MHKILYPKLLALSLSFVLAYVLFDLGVFDVLPTLFRGHGYISMFLGGLLFSFGFTTPFAIVIFIEMAPLVHPVFGALIAGAGAVVSDMTIFEFIRFSFLDELHRLKRTSVIRYFRDKLHHETAPERIRQYTLWAIAGVIVASPLPDEIGVSLLSGFTEVKGKPFAALCFAFNSVGIMTVLLITQAVI